MVAIRYRLLIIVGFTTYFLLSYFAIAHFVERRGLFYSIALPGEERIPFLPWTFFVYALVYVVPAIGFLLLESREMLKRAFWAFFAALWIHKVVWIFFPVKFLFRPIPDQSGGPFLRFLDSFYGLDSAALNCFPSLHVTYAFMTYLGLKWAGVRSAPVFLPVAILISASTLTFKQHYLLDIAAGMIVAISVSYFFFRKQRPERAQVREGILRRSSENS